MWFLYGLYGILRKIVWFILKCNYKVKFEGLENIPKESGYIYASNHRSYFDPVWITLPVRTFMSTRKAVSGPAMRLSDIRRMKTGDLPVSPVLPTHGLKLSEIQKNRKK